MYHFTRSHPTIDITPHLSKTSEAFRIYIKRGLEKVEQQYTGTGGTVQVRLAFELGQENPSAQPVTLRARWVTLRARWVTLRARWVTLRARWVALRARRVTLRARWVTLAARWMPPRARWVTLRSRWVTLRAHLVTLQAKAQELGVPRGPMYGKLQRGEAVTLPDGRVFTQRDVCAADAPGALCLLVDCPSLAHLPSLLAAPALQPYMHGDTPGEVHPPGSVPGSWHSAANPTPSPKDPAQESLRAQFA